MIGEYISIETAKRIAELERELKEANESVTWWSNRYKSLQEINKIQARKIIDYKLKKDRVIKLIHKAMVESDITGNGTLNLNDLLNILNGENNE